VRNERIRQLMDRRGERWTEMRAIMDAASARGSDLTAEETERYDALERELDADERELERLQRHEERGRGMDEVRRDPAQLPGGDRPAQRSEQREAYNRAFGAYLRRGINRLNAEELEILATGFVSEERALAIAPGSAGGYLVPQGFYDVLTTARKQFGGMRQARTTQIRTDTGNDMPMPTANDTGNVGELLAENTQTAALDIAFASQTIHAYVFSSKEILVSYQLLQDSVFDLETYLAQRCGERIGRIENAYFTTGTGTAQPQGVVTAATSGKIGIVGQTTTIIYDDIIDLVHSVDPAYRMFAQWMLSDNAIRTIRKIKDANGQPIWQLGTYTGVVDGNPSTIDGYPYIVNQDVPVMAANARSVLFGDFSSYLIRDAQDVTLLRNDYLYMNKLQVSFMSYARSDGALLDAGTHPIKYYANSAT
jgi:HK97 family phage major capsid protein